MYANGWWTQCNNWFGALLTLFGVSVFGFWPGVRSWLCQFAHPPTPDVSSFGFTKTKPLSRVQPRMIFGVTGAGLPLKQKCGFHLQGPSAFQLDRQPSPCPLAIRRRWLRDKEAAAAQADAASGKDCFCVQKLSATPWRN
ncbi:hypothetical protein BWR18_04750 [Tateyamaria omphalii]|uniref:Uncharacterized protein n=1 Tax=Tateyamaria omphalii TaxID=299262 RepID=A0A1P8MSV4_9RHOB|nr:hypothetical protein BWR18_04750 [Tateyamaria omphalii]